MSECVLGNSNERLDPLNGVYHQGQGCRSYSPGLMHFIQPDVLSPFDVGGINSYAYCNGDPVNIVDPSGHCSIGGAVGIGLGVVGVLLTPVSAGTSLAAALSVAAVVAGVASVGLGIAAEVINDHKTAEILGWTSLALGVVSGVGATAVSRLAPKANSLIGMIDSRLGTLLQHQSRFLGNLERGARGQLGVGGGGRLTRSFYPIGATTEPPAAMLTRQTSSVPGMDAFLALPERERPMIATGTQAAVYTVNDEWVVKGAMRGVHDTLDPVALALEADIFRAVHGPNSALVSHYMLWMRKIPGRPASSLGLIGTEAKAMGQKITAELLRLRRMGISHGDPHWDNVLVDEENMVRFIDFGKSKFI
ncbi:RHS repeat-associated core domain-containing protein [Chromobacterium vaccinii]|uniref:RHS repeat-associated core domain-containing protein n=1 Tax=Chromobacterium vaccinii TaxID=1108595 RepID=UPI003C72F7B4